MSYGWLTESALLPKESKKIEVDSSSLVDLKVILAKKNVQQDNAKQKFGKEKIIQINKNNQQMQQQNKGVQERITKDISSNIDNKKVSNSLEEKSKIYNLLQKKGHYVDKFLIDFQQKKIDNMDEQEKQEYEEAREQFYSMKKNELKQKESNILLKRNNITQAGLLKELNQEEIERYEWEQETLKELENGISNELKDNRKKGTVLQSYDKFLSKDEKEELPNIIKEENDEKNKLNEAKRKRQEILELRLQKIQKLNKQQ